MSEHERMEMIDEAMAASDLRHFAELLAHDETDVWVGVEHCTTFVEIDNGTRPISKSYIGQ